MKLSIDLLKCKQNHSREKTNKNLTSAMTQIPYQGNGLKIKSRGLFFKNENSS